MISPRRPTAKVQFEGLQVLSSISARVGATYIVTAVGSPQLFASGARGPQARAAPASTANVPRRTALVSAVYWSMAFAALSLLLLTSSVEAQQSTAADDAATDDSAAQTLTSTEQGRTTITDSFKSRQDKIREERRTAFAGTEFTWEVRTYDLDRINSDDSRASAWAIGGSAGFQTGTLPRSFLLRRHRLHLATTVCPERRGGHEAAHQRSVRVHRARRGVRAYQAKR